MRQRLAIGPRGYSILKESDEHHQSSRLPAIQAATYFHTQEIEKQFPVARLPDMINETKQSSI